ncbi:MAG TPA: hypothetical protein VMB80_07655 [Candidatus Acidoferrum sp.]|nr:hypothetical protein [Candidatus Acidoferrum sp.]
MAVLQLLGDNKRVKPRDAILLTVGIWLIESLFAIRFGNAIVPVAVFLNAGMALWAAVDSTKIQLKRYKSGISYGPIVLFIAIALLWIIGFPWYLVMRYKIKTGTAVLKDELPKAAA